MARTGIIKTASCVVLIFAAALSVGCKKASAWAEPAVGGRDRRGAYEMQFGYESLATDSARLRAATARAGGGYETPWYVMRNDMKPATYAGSAWTSFERSVTWTRDHQYTSGSSVSDYYSQHTYRVRVQDATNP